MRLKHFEIKDKELILNYDSKNQAVISLNNEGGRLKSLVLDNKIIISDLKHKPYKESFASAILFPFANRINNGNYSFKDKIYSLECNESDRNNAIHGLVYNKTFELIKTQKQDKFLEVELQYIENQSSEGFPFPFKILLSCKLFKNKFSLKVKIKNTGTEAFPYTIGWHPYFYCKDLKKSYLKFESNKVVITNSKMIPEEILEQRVKYPLLLENKKLDDCFILSDNQVVFDDSFKTIKIRVSEKSKYFQIYTPPNEDKIALEPMTGFSDSFNHKKGLQILKPKCSSQEIWSVELF